MLINAQEMRTIANVEHWLCSRMTVTAFKLTSPINTMKEDAHLAGDKTEALSDQATEAKKN